MKDENTNDQRLEALFSEAFSPKPTPEETEQAWQEFIHNRRQMKQKRLSYWAIASAAAVLVLCIVLWPMLNKESSQEIQVFASLSVPTQTTIVEEGQQVIVSTPAQQTTTVLLSDGTEVLLNANSRLEYPKEFSGGQRSVTLTGEARFHVTKDTRHPFIVHTQQIQTQVLGTVFDVKAYPQGTPDVTLYEGKVAVSLNGEEVGQTLQPGEQATIDNNGRLQLTQATPDKGKWAEGEFVFDDQQLMTVMQEIASWYNVSVVFRSRPLLEERIYFRMNREQQLEKVLEVLNDIGIARFEQAGGKVIVRP